MKERPILFSGAMVRAILAGTKTQTRRIVKPQSEFGIDECHWVGGFSRLGESGCLCSPVKCPYGVPGDRLWVREAWHPCARLGSEYEIEYRADGTTLTHDVGFDGPTPKLDAAIEGGWRPSIHMPRWASRLTLEIVSIRVERLQDISEEDAKAEGVAQIIDPANLFSTYRGPYETLWREINGPGSWEANPWVWVVKFKKGEVGK